jgi:hypothetical protein
MVTIVIANTPNNASAATMAIIAIDIFAVFCKWSLAVVGSIIVRNLILFNN